MDDAIEFPNRKLLLEKKLRPQSKEERWALSSALLLMSASHRSPAFLPDDTPGDYLVMGGSFATWLARGPPPV